MQLAAPVVPNAFLEIESANDKRGWWAGRLEVNTAKCSDGLRPLSDLRTRPFPDRSWPPPRLHAHGQTHRHRARHVRRDRHADYRRRDHARRARSHARHRARRDPRARLVPLALLS